MSKGQLLFVAVREQDVSFIESALYRGSICLSLPL